MKTQIILEEASPYETFAATVEDDGRSIYLYMSPLKDENLEAKAVWIRNRIPAPADTDKESMKNGIAPCLKKSSCSHPDGLGTIQKENLGILWFQEGNGVCIYLDGKLEALIPPWSGKDGLFGYSAQCTAPDAGTVPLLETNTGLMERIKENEEFWEKRKDPSFWSNYRDSLLENYEKIYGNHKQYYTLSDRKYPPLAVAEFEKNNLLIYATVGMSFQNMPMAELSVKDPESVLRAEIITARATREEWMPGLMGRLAVYPWLYNRWLGQEHTYESGLTQPFTDFIILKEYEESFLERPGNFSFENKHVNFLLALPVHQEDLLLIKAKGVPHILKKIREKAKPAYRWPS
ncbi:MAG: suppressor of fused domain protein [Spirochaetia bacterium]|nr:suppressor of fused domain protein [Spirochaetia bacterium]